MNLPEAMKFASEVQEAIVVARNLHGSHWPGIRANLLDQLFTAAVMRQRSPQAIAVEAAKNAGGMAALMIVAAAFDSGEVDDSCCAGHP